MKGSEDLEFQLDRHLGRLTIRHRPTGVWVVHQFVESAPVAAMRELLMEQLRGVVAAVERRPLERTLDAPPDCAVSAWCGAVAGELVEVEIVGCAPVQAFGEVRGRSLHFRSRHSEWHFEVGDELWQLPSDGFPGFLIEGKHRNASYMTHGRAMEHILVGVEQYLQDS